MEKIGKRDGAGLSTGHGNASQSSDRKLFLAIREELTALKAAGTITQADANAQTGAYVQADVQSIADLANALKAALNGIAALVEKFEE